MTGSLRQADLSAVPRATIPVLLYYPSWANLVRNRFACERDGVVMLARRTHDWQKRRWQPGRPVRPDGSGGGSVSRAPASDIGKDLLPWVSWSDARWSG